MAAHRTASSRTALVFGASGITGWAIVREATRYPASDTFNRIIGLTNRPLDPKSSFLPNDDRVILTSGIDLTVGAEIVSGKLRDVPGIEDVTDVYFAGVSLCMMCTLR